MQDSYDTVKFSTFTYEGKDSVPKQFDEALKIYADLIKDPAFARVWAGGVLPRGTSLTLVSDIIDLDDLSGFMFPSFRRYDKKGTSVSENADCWKITRVKYTRYSSGRSAKGKKCGWRVPKRLRKQGRLAKEVPDPRNFKALYFTYGENDEIVWHTDCIECHGSFELDSRMCLVCSKCGLVHE